MYDIIFCRWLHVFLLYKTIIMILIKMTIIIMMIIIILITIIIILIIISYAYIAKLGIIPGQDGIIKV